MKSNVVTLAIRAALFLLIANIVMLFIVQRGTAEWYITIVSIVLMILLITIAKIIAAIKDKGNKQ